MRSERKAINSKTFATNFAVALTSPARFTSERMSDVTRILNSIEQDDSNAAEELLPLVYEELRRLPAQKMANEKPGQTLQATALVHEAWVKIRGGGRESWKNRSHFFAAAAEAMDLPLRKVERIWTFARSWLRDAIKSQTE